MLTHEGLRLLLLLKLRGGLRAQWRRMKRPRNWIFLALGTILVLGWLWSFLHGSRRISDVGSTAWLDFGTRVGLLVLVLLTLVGAFSHRGLYLPKDEIEVCFTAPVSRSDLIRYRLVVNQAKSLFAALVFGIGAATRMPVGAFGFAGAFLTMLTIPIVAQATAIALGSAENGFLRSVSKAWLRVFAIALTACLIVVVLTFVAGQSSLFGGLIRDGRVSVEAVASEPIVRAVLWPCEPWARMITAREAGEFWPWLAFAVTFWFLAFELTARIPVDYRELSLETSADVAKRLNRMRRGTWATSGSTVARSTIGWRVPWVFGRGGFGAVAWRKLASIVREARGALILSAVIVAFLAALATVPNYGSGSENLLVGSLLVSGFGTVYLCTGLRFDFRRDLEVMGLVKSWPVRPSAIFLATLLPEVVLVTILLTAVLVARALYLRTFDPALLGILAFQPLLTLAWVALDNAVFLYSPLRYTPGEEGALQHMGRSLVLMLLRMLVFALVVVVSGGPAVVTWLALEQGLGLDRGAALWIAGVVAWFGLAVVDAGLVLAGGALLRRFDVARDRGV